MATPSEKLGASLAVLERLQDGNRRVFRSRELTRVHRERLIRNGFLREVMKGWLMSSSPDAAPSETTPWFASFWEFCVAYCTARFDEQWHLSPEQSLLLHAENTVIPTQVVIYTPGGANNRIKLLFGTSLFDLKRKEIPPEADLTRRDGLRLYTPEAALIKVPAAFFARNPIEARVALSGIRDASGVLSRLLGGGHSTVAGRLAGAFRRIGRGEIADDILTAMKRAGYDVRESDPFQHDRTLGGPSRTEAPIVGRLQSLWESMRETAIALFPEAPGLQEDSRAYLAHVDDIYQYDAYHSLSIEGYRVTPGLIERVRSGNWDPDNRAVDRRGRDALAARGYWQAFQLVRNTVSEVMAGGSPAALIRAAHGDWYRELFQPSVEAGLIGASTLAGYRNHAVFPRASRHLPPSGTTVRSAMPAFFDLLEGESEPSAQAVLGHWLFGYIHPYPDGNGRLARFVMNVLLASAGYPWTVVRVEDRDGYLAALESASVAQEIEPFTRFLAQRVASSSEVADGLGN
ncbi:MAG: Fic family protein [Gammaproteobacteria bacterium]|nr:Fic family protein [Gammaproteobacteria bacterium]